MLLNIVYVLLFVLYTAGVFSIGKCLGNINLAIRLWKAEDEPMWVKYLVKKYFGTSIYCFGLCLLLLIALVVL